MNEYGLFPSFYGTKYSIDYIIIEEFEVEKAVIFDLENRRKSSQIINDDICLPFFLSFI